MLGKLKNLFTGYKKIDYAEARKLANHEDAGVRLKLAQREDIVPEIESYHSYDKLPVELIPIDRKGKRFF